ncbi:MAG: cell division protein FtsK [Epulopiscium sp. Nuni2H_MBin003]|nr:MAG: cell division protein FtsK [Epulopiscium sp. Nuni2H_MBin003]
MAKKAVAKKIVTKKVLKKANPMNNEIIGLSIIGICLLILVSLFTANTGFIGLGIRKLLVGLLGISGYILPIYVIFLGWTYLKHNFEAVRENFVVVLPMLIITTMVAHLINYSSKEGIRIIDATYFTEGSFRNGGFIGATLSEISLKLVGVYGTYILIIILIAMWIVTLTEYPLMKKLRELVKMTEEIPINMQQKKHTPTKKPSNMSKPKKKEMPRNEPAKSDSYDMITNYDIVQTSHSSAPAKIHSYDTPSTIETTNSEITLPNFTKPVQMTLNNNDTGTLRMSGNIYHFPNVNLLAYNEKSYVNQETSKDLMERAHRLEETLLSFGVEAKVVQIHKGPSVTRYELVPKQGVKVSKIVNLADDIALNLAARGVRIEAPIPGKSAVGIEIPNASTEIVYLKDVIDSNGFNEFPSKLAFALGKDISGKPVIADIAKMPHILIAGATGSGKSVCINTLITSILYKAKPDEVKLIMIDPKVVELSIYNGIPHLLIPVVTDPKKAAGALGWAVNEMTKRYSAFAENGVRDMKGFNEKEPSQKMPQIVIIIDELADLMMTAAKDVEDSICRLAQMARAAGIHLVIATQRPSVDVITGVIKANIPSRLAFSVSSGIDSRTILDSVGAEKLLGKGDMLFNPIGESKPIRIQGAFISDKEVETIVNSVKVHANADYKQDVLMALEKPTIKLEQNSEDELLPQAIEILEGKEKVSISMLQRYFRIGFNRAARLMEELEDRGFVGPDEGSKPRVVLSRDNK